MAELLHLCSYISIQIRRKPFFNIETWQTTEEFWAPFTNGAGRGDIITETIILVSEEAGFHIVCGS